MTTRNWMVGGVLCRDGRVLLCRRRPDRVSYPGVWDLPGGHVEPGEDDGTALTREIGEELGVEVLSSVGVALAEPTEGTFLSVRLISDWRGEPHNTAPAEHSEIGWFGADDVTLLELPEPDSARALGKGSAQRHLYRSLLADLLRPSTSPELRRLGEEAADSVGALHALSRHETYKNLLPPCSRVRFRPADLTAHWRLRAKSESMAVQGGLSGAVLLGFVATSRVGEGQAELNALHVRPDWHGRGLAERLHSAALARVLGEGGREMRLWVVEGNARARRFYEKHGWRLGGDRRLVPVDSDMLPAVTYVRQL